MDKLKEKMLYHRVTSGQVADLLGVSQPQAHRMIFGKRKLSRERRALIVDAWPWMKPLIPKGT